MLHIKSHDSPEINKIPRSLCLSFCLVIKHKLETRAIVLLLAASYRFQRSYRKFADQAAQVVGTAASALRSHTTCSFKAEVTTAWPKK